MKKYTNPSVEFLLTLPNDVLSVSSDPVIDGNIPTDIGEDIFN